jgi:hypothetical protein
LLSTLAAAVAAAITAADASNNVSELMRSWYFGGAY